MPQITAKIEEVIQHVPHERTQIRMKEQTAEFPVPQITAKISLDCRGANALLKWTVEAVTMVTFEPVQQRIVEQVADASQFREEAVEVERLVARERVQRRINEQIVEVPLPQNVVQRVTRIMREAVQSRRVFELLMSEEPFLKICSSSLFLLMFQRVH